MWKISQVKQVAISLIIILLSACGDDSTKTSTTTKTPAPTANIQNASAIILSWQTITSKNYYRLFSNNTAIYSGTNTSYTHTGLTPNTSYDYSLRACTNSDITTCYTTSTITSATTFAKTPAPTASVQSISTIIISWQAIASKSYYRLFSNNAAIYSGANTRYTHTGLTHNTSYNYSLRACTFSDITTCGATSTNTRATTFATTTIAVPQPPPTPNAHAQSTSTIILSWQANASEDNVTLYEIYQNTTNTISTNPIATPSFITNATNTVYHSTGLDVDSLYYYWLKACNNQGCSASTAVSTRTQAAIAEAVKSINDTGITWGGNYSTGNNGSCRSNIPSKQDCHFGRDASLSLDTNTFTYNASGTVIPKVGAGVAGFDFTKLGRTGNVLAIQNNTWSNSGTENAGTQWSCVKDNVTSAVWEVKTDVGASSKANNIHHQDNDYQWGGLTALGRDHARREGEYFNDWNDLITGTNAEELCGFNDWRVPTITELDNIVHKGKINPSIDDNYFPNTLNNIFWSSSPNANNNTYARTINFSTGRDSGSIVRTTGHPVRLIRLER